MRLEIRYLNEFTYSEPARESHNALRACPTEDVNQELIDYRVRITPEASVNSYIDYWGTKVDEFSVRQAHDALQICAESVVETRSPLIPANDPPLVDYESLGQELSEYLRPSPHAIWDNTVRDAAATTIRGEKTAMGAINAISATVTTTIEYSPGATFIGVPVADVLKKQQGVCQDFAHLSIAMCRSVGIPARYVSGYLYSKSQTDAVAPNEVELDVQTHAWFEVYVPGHGWWGLDPTNPQPIGELHVKIGHGRDYEDVMPLRGVYHGGDEHALGVRVQITREGLRDVSQQ